MGLSREGLISDGAKTGLNQGVSKRAIAAPVDRNRHRLLPLLRHVHNHVEMLTNCFAYFPWPHESSRKRETARNLLFPRNE